jgi:uncharacterized protein (DUF305 family)
MADGDESSTKPQEIVLAEESTGRSRPSQRTVTLALTLVAAILLGIAIGFLGRLWFQDDATTPGADSVDVGFSQDMTVHHNQAIEMSTVALTKSTNTEVRNLAYDILTTQQNQVGYMQGWLALWGQAPFADDGYMKWMDDSSSGHEHGGMSMDSHDMSEGMMAMPGMATSADLTNLRKAEGPELDVLFLQLMLRHHQGGKEMGEYGAEHAESAVVRNIANSMVKTQDSESALMTEMLAQRNAQPLPMN